MYDTIFIKYDKPQHTTRFRKALIDMRGQQCEICKMKEWLNQPIHLELHHIDGDKSNNTLTNLQLLCPNCHSYTDNYGSKNKHSQEVLDEELIQALKSSSTIRQALLSLNMSDSGANYTRARNLIASHDIELIKNSLKDKESFCVDCGKVIYPGSTRCNSCEASSRKAKHIPRDELKALIRTTSFTQIGKIYGVSDNAIRKWCDNYNLPRKVSDIKQISDEDWKLI